MSFFADQNVRISRICNLNRDDMYRIIEHGIDPVDRVGLARGCRERMAEVVKVISHYGAKRFRGVAHDLHEAVQFTLRTIESLLRPRWSESEIERPVELEAAEILVEVITLVVRVELLKIRQLEGLSRALWRLDSEAAYFSRVSEHANPALRQLDRKSVFEIERKAGCLSLQLNDALSDIPCKIAQLRKRPRYIDYPWA